MELKNQNKDSGQKQKTEHSNVIFEDDFLQCTFGFEGEHNYAVSTENGSIVKKGSFKDGFYIDLSGLSRGYCHLTIFNELKRDVFAFQIK